MYLTLPPVAGLVTPLLSLVAFASTPLVAGAPPTPLRFIVGADDLRTTAVNGSRSLTGGVYAFTVGGHQPGDANGDAVSNVLAGTITLAAAA